METTEATMFTSQGPCTLRDENCGMAKVTPATRIAGQTSSMPPKPAKAQISQKGTRMQNGARMRPVIARKRDLADSR